MIQPEAIDNPIFITSNQQLSDQCSLWADCELLAVDTEFIRTDTFYPKEALIQICDGRQCFLIDPLTIDNFDPLASVFTDESVLKVMHSCSEDMEVFATMMGVIPSPIIDTQVAAAMDGYGFSLSYQKLVAQVLDIDVPKGETRSNWLQRPLSAAQIHYAVLDVAYLPQMLAKLQQSLLHKGRIEWLHEECANLANHSTDEEKMDLYYRKVKSAWKLTAMELTLLQKLIRWREQEARRKDVPRGRVVKDNTCRDIAKLRPGSIAELDGVDELSPGAIRRYGQSILDIVKSLEQSSESDYVQVLDSPLPASARSLLKLLKARVGELAQGLQLAPEILARKRDYESLIRSVDAQGAFELPEQLNGWRRDVVGNSLLNIANSFKFK